MKWTDCLVSALAFTVTQLLPLQAEAAHPTRIVAISASFADHTCALTSAGGVKCWGANEAGQLGNNDYVHSAVPVNVLSLDRGVLAIGTGDEFTCALTNVGNVKCWGYNSNGQLGNPAFPDGSPVPVDVIGLGREVVALSVGGHHACAITNHGGVKCWGWNGDGQLGDGTTTDGATPTDVVGLASGVIGLATGSNHTCALSAHGGIKCWGWNGFGVFGDGTNSSSLTPIEAGLTTGVSAIAAGAFHMCGLSTRGVLKCWGLNLMGQVGSGSGAQIEFSPVEVVSIGHHVQSVAAGSFHTCALGAGPDYCWGRNVFGELGDGTTVDRATPVRIKGLPSSARAITGGQDHTCALTEDGGVKCWGWNIVGQLGNDSFTDSLNPISVVGLGGN
jgi:alpha-tubulin suppressor-like RCC1 family protein